MSPLRPAASPASALAALLVVCTCACKEDAPRPVPPPMAAPRVASAEAPRAPAPEAVPTGKVTLSFGAPPPATTDSLDGTVAEALDAGNYTYLRLTTALGDKWAAVPQVKVKVGEKVTVTHAMVMTKFASPTLKRSFDEILFGTLAPRGGLEGQAANALAGSGAAAAPTGPVAHMTGPNAHTVAEVFANKAALKDKPVVIRGRVTKFNAGILGHTWIHISDGTGSKATGDDDLTVTTQGSADVGEVVIIRGPVHLDRDFGSGYAYAVMIEDATLDR